VPGLPGVLSPSSFLHWGHWVKHPGTALHNTLQQKESEGASWGRSGIRRQGPSAFNNPFQEKSEGTFWGDPFCCSQGTYKGEAGHEWGQGRWDGGSRGLISHLLGPGNRRGAPRFEGCSGRKCGARGEGGPCAVKSETGRGAQ